MVRVPEPLKMGPTPFLHGKPHHDTETRNHDPARGAWASEEVGGEEGEYVLPCGYRLRICPGHFGKVEHVRYDVDDSPNDNGPCGGFVEGDALVEGNDLAEGRAAEEGDEIAADGEENENDVDVKNQGSGASDDVCGPIICASVHQIVFELVIDSAKGSNEQMKENPNREEQLSTTFVDHP